VTPNPASITLARYDRAIHDARSAAEQCAPLGTANLESVRLCAQQQHAKDLKNGLANLQKQVDKMKDGPEKQRLEASLTVLETQGDNNGVNVNFGAVPNGAAGTTFDVNAQTNQVNAANITFDPNKISSSNDYAIGAPERLGRSLAA